MENQSGGSGGMMKNSGHVTQVGKQLKSADHNNTQLDGQNAQGITGLNLYHHAKFNGCLTMCGI